MVMVSPAIGPPDTLQPFAEVQVVDVAQFPSWAVVQALANASLMLLSGEDGEKIIKAATKKTPTYKMGLNILKNDNFLLTILVSLMPASGFMLFDFVLFLFQPVFYRQSELTLLNYSISGSFCKVI